MLWLDCWGTYSYLPIAIPKSLEFSYTFRFGFILREIGSKVGLFQAINNLSIRNDIHARLRILFWFSLLSFVTQAWQFGVPYLCWHDPTWDTDQIQRKLVDMAVGENWEEKKMQKRKKKNPRRKGKRNKKGTGRWHSSESFGERKNKINPWRRGYNQLKKRWSFDKKRKWKFWREKESTAAA